TLHLYYLYNNPSNTKIYIITTLINLPKINIHINISSFLQTLSRAQSQTPPTPAAPSPASDACRPTRWDSIGPEKSSTPASTPRYGRTCPGRSWVSGPTRSWQGKPGRDLR
ncbi:Fas-binding factor 1 homolog, partial [Striga asiatica]